MSPLLLTGGLAVFGALLLASTTLLAPARPSVRLGPAATRVGGTAGASLHRRALTAAGATIEERARRHGLDALLEEAGMAWRPSEVAVVGAVAAVVALLLGTMLSGVLTGLLLAGLVVGGGRLFLGTRRSRRQQQFADQLPELLQLLAGSVRSGYGLRQALEMAAEEIEAPTSDELGRVTAESRLGRDLDESLEAVADRVGSEDFRWVVQAIAINRTIGGDLATVLDAVSATIRSRSSLQRHVRAITAEGRMSAIVLSALPPGLLAVTSVISPGYTTALFSGFGVVLLGVAVVLMLVGLAWLRRLVRPVF